MEEQKQKARDYIVAQMQSGVPADTIANHLRAAGWTEEHIQEVFQMSQQQFMPQQFQQPTAEPVAEPTPQAEAAQLVAATEQPAVTAQPEVAPTVAAAQQPVTQPTGIMPAATPTKRGRIKNGWLLFKQSMKLLRGNKSLLRYLLMTGITVFAFNVVLIVLYIAFDKVDLRKDENATLTLLGYVLGFIDYLGVYFLINYYAAGLTANILDIYQGQSKPYSEYMKLARAKLRPIFIFSLISATVGFILQYVVERIRYVGWIISWLLGTAWSLGTLFVVPIIMSKDNPGGVREIRESVSFFKQTWGENITTKVSVNTPLALINILLALGFLVLSVPLVMAGGLPAVWALWILFVLVLFVTAVIGSFANSAVNVALFYFATRHEVPPAYDADLLNSVFISHKRRFFGKKSEA